MEEFRRALAIVREARPSFVDHACNQRALLYPSRIQHDPRPNRRLWPLAVTRDAARGPNYGRHISLTPSLTWKTRIAQIKSVQPGEFVGYGLTYQASHQMKVGVLPIGYYDGYDRKLSNCGRVLAGGQAVPVLGRVMMKMIVIDVTHVDVQPDDEVVLIGRQGKSEIRVELAERSERSRMRWFQDKSGNPSPGLVGLSDNV
jgi:alanine racemase